MRFVRVASLGFICFAFCGGASWADTFTGKDTRSTFDAGVLEEDDSGEAGVVTGCTGLTITRAPVTPITVTFPGHGTASATIHVVAGSSSCDLIVDSQEDGVVFVSDASPCVSLLSPAGSSVLPSNSTATAEGSPTDVLFQWTYGGICTIDDDYVLSAR